MNRLRLLTPAAFELSRRARREEALVGRISKARARMAARRARNRVESDAPLMLGLVLLFVASMLFVLCITALVLATDARAQELVALASGVSQVTR